MNKAFFKQKKIYIPFAVIVFLVVLRMALPQILLYQTNKYLSEFSPTYYLHMDDLDISILKGSYRFEKIHGNFKEDNKKFVAISSVEVSIAWREIFKGRIVTDIVTKDLDFLFLKDMSKLSVPNAKKDAQDVKDTLFPVKVESVDLNHARVVFEEYPSLDEASRLKIEDINGKITNLTPSKEDPHSNFNLTASLQGSSAFVFIGSLNLTQKPMLWDVDVELKDFDLATLNNILKRKLPLTFTKGKVDLYAEAKNDNKMIKGYIKPFIKDIDVVKSNEKFVSLKHFGYEVITAIANLILRDSDTKTVATYLDFSYDGKFNVSTGQGISNAIENGFKQKLNPGIEDKYHLEK